MNAKLLFKTVFLLLVLMLLVLMGLNNPQAVSFHLPPLLPKPIQQRAALMFFAFFATGLLTGTILAAGRGGTGGEAGKPAKGRK